jgi:uncharacterized membrane protein YukC
MTKLQNSKLTFVFGYWILGFIWNLVLGICYLAMLQYSSTPKQSAIFTGKAIDL